MHILNTKRSWNKVFTVHEIVGIVCIVIALREAYYFYSVGSRGFCLAWPRNLEENGGRAVLVVVRCGS